MAFSRAALSFTIKIISAGRFWKSASCSSISFKICSVGSLPCSNHMSTAGFFVSSLPLTVLPFSSDTLNSSRVKLSSMSARSAWYFSSFTVFVSPSPTTKMYRLAKIFPLGRRLSVMTLYWPAGTEIFSSLPSHFSFSRSRVWYPPSTSWLTEKSGKYAQFSPSPFWKTMVLPPLSRISTGTKRPSS